MGMERFTVKFLKDDSDEGIYLVPNMEFAASHFAEEEAEAGMIETQEEFDAMPPIQVTDSEGNKKLFRILVETETTYNPCEVQHG